MSTSKSTIPAAAWDFPVRFLKGVGDKLALIFKKDEILTLWDLLLFLPRTYEDRTKLWSYNELLTAMEASTQVMAKARIVSCSEKMGGRGGRRWLELTAVMEDNPRHRVIFTFFNDFGGSIAMRFPEGTDIIFRGKVQGFRGDLQVIHPELDMANKELPEWESGWVPIYREISGLSTKVIRRIVAQAMLRDEFKNIPEGLPEKLCREQNFPTLKQSLSELHFPRHWIPDKAGELRPEGIYYRRVAFEELFMMALALHLRRAEWRAEKNKKGIQVPEVRVLSPFTEKLLRSLPYVLTGDQATVLQEILTDMRLEKDPVPMHRLIQGDVGSGKTIVAFLAALHMMEAGYQVAMMAPTEILADQHFESFQKLFSEQAGRAGLLKGSLRAREKKAVHEKISTGELQLVIGTQALLSEGVVFKKLGLVIVDEQHRFGVEQRLAIQDENLRPHLMVMTATPIPRSLALTLYGDLNLSLIKEKPKGRIPISTHLVRESARVKLQERLKVFLAEGRQLYIVYPLVEESEELDLKDAQSAFAEWKTVFGASVAVDLLHGKMKTKAKELAMRKFKEGATRVLVATTVIEVGVDVPNASVIVIEHAERFGLSQLHQLRGRVGRGSQKSYCVLVAAESAGALGLERLKSLEASDDGFLIAEKDLELRGPGEFLGRRQSGLAGFRVAHILRDLHLMELAREEARKILEHDPHLLLPENAQLRSLITKWWHGRMELTLAG